MEVECILSVKSTKSVTTDILKNRIPTNILKARLPLLFLIYYSYVPDICIYRINLSDMIEIPNNMTYWKLVQSPNYRKLQEGKKQSFPNSE